MVIRLVSVSDRTDLPGLHDVFHAILGWSGDLSYLVRIHGQEFNSFRRSTRSKALRDFQLHRQEKFLYVCDVMDLWEWDVRVLDIQQGIQDDHTPLCLGGRGAPPPEYCGGPRGYRLMLKRQQEGRAIADPASVEATIQMLALTHPDQPARTWDLLRETLDEGWRSIDRPIGTIRAFGTESL
jgi:Plasmid pRiA4b ORF-3-like protein